MYDLIIVGGGPAGLTAAIYSIRKRLNVFLVSNDLGGKTNYRLSLPNVETHDVIRGAEVVEKFWRELDYLDFARHLDSVTSIKHTGDSFVLETSDGSELQSRSVIYATGSRVVHLDVPGELEFAGKGLSYSAVSHAPLLIEKRAVVVGGGALAMRAVAELSLVASSVHLVTNWHEMIDSPILEKLSSQPNVSIWQGYTVDAIEGGDFAERVLLSSPGRDPVTIETDCVFVELGLIPNTEPIAGLVGLDEFGRVVVDNRNRTNLPGFFAAGDVSDAYAEQVLIAVGEGAKAALSAYEYLLPAI